MLDDLEKSINFHPFAPGGSFAGPSARGPWMRGRSAAAAGQPDALVALGAVANLAALAGDRMLVGRPDRRYRRPVKVRKPRLARIAPGPGLDASAAQALHKLLSAEARAWSLINAMAVARARSLAAIRARDVKAARRQARASGQFASQAAKALRPVPGLRKATAAALQRAGTPEMTVALPQVLAYQDSVRRGGLPADMRARLTQLGLDRAEQKSVATVILGKAPETAAGRVLIEPLTDPSRLAATSGLAKQLARQAATSRKQPFTVSEGSPRTVEGTAPRSPTILPSRHRRR